ncbi:MAG: carboxypeptidase-like regulatory domain-containing protein, partial [Bacteroidetes bacterium]|nr:carboxypeptidase-like regulatory domain-containing protein [Bacteroidota bacterium]
LQIISAAGHLQSRTVAVASDSVTAAKENMAAMAIQFAKRGKVKALLNNDLTLAKHLDHAIGFILNANKTLAVNRALEIKDQLNSNLSILTNISAADITELTEAINTFDNIKDQPRTNIQERSASGTIQLATAFVTIFKAIDNMNDLVHSYFTKTNKPLVDEFDLACQVISTGIHHTGVEGVILKDGQALANVTIKITGTDKEGVTDLEGHYVIAKIKAGDYTIEATTEDGHKTSKTIHLSRGQFEKVDFSF